MKLSFYSKLSDYAYLDKKELKAEVGDFLQIPTDAIQIVEYKDVLCYIAKRGIDTFICLRGSQSVKNWVSNSKFVKSKEIHRGFREIAEGLMILIKQNICKESKLHLTGHSLSGSLSLILSNWLYEDGYNVDIVCAIDPANFASKKYIKATNNYNFKRFIVKNNLSIVSMIPFDFMDYANYEHIMIYLNRNEKVRVGATKLYRALDKILTINSPDDLLEFGSDHKIYYITSILEKSEKAGDLLDCTDY